MKTLTMHQNGIKTLDQNVADWSSLDFYDLTGNPLNCDCSVKWLNELFSSNSDLPRPLCQSPDKLHGQVMGEIKDKDLKCKSGGPGGRKRTGKIVGIFLGVVIFLAALLFGYFRFWRRTDPSGNDQPFKSKSK